MGKTKQRTDADLILIARLLNRGKHPIVIKLAVAAEGGNIRQAAYSLGLKGPGGMAI